MNQNITISIEDDKFEKYHQQNGGHFSRPQWDNVMFAVTTTVWHNIRETGLSEVPRTCASAPWDLILLATYSHKLRSGM